MFVCKIQVDIFFRYYAVKTVQNLWARYFSLKIGGGGGGGGQGSLWESSQESIVICSRYKSSTNFHSQYNFPDDDTTVFYQHSLYWISLDDRKKKQHSNYKQKLQRRCCAPAGDRAEVTPTENNRLNNNKMWKQFN